MAKPKPEPEKYACVSWNYEDVKALRPRWSKARCEEELGSLESDIQDRMTERGWDVLEQLLPSK